jgi:hypothetical protein
VATSLASGVFGLVAIAAWSATATSRGAVVLWAGNDQWIKIEQQDDSGAGPSAHPAHLSTDEVTSALASLRVVITDKDSGTETQRTVFTREELSNLAPQVAAGLAKAGPQQDVTFSTIGSHALSAGGVVKDPGVNAGRIFYREGKLNVIFGELQSNYRKKNLYGQRTDDFTPRREGSRVKTSKQKFSLVAAPGIEFHAMSGGAVRNDWVMIDPAIAASQMAGTPAPAAATPRQATPASAESSPSSPPSANSAASAPAVAALAMRFGWGSIDGRRSDVSRSRTAAAEAQGTQGQGPDQRRGLQHQGEGAALRALGDLV